MPGHGVLSGRKFLTYAVSVAKHKATTRQASNLKKLKVTRSRTHMVRNKNALLIGCLSFAIFYLPGCDNKPEQKNTRKPIDYIKKIPGLNDSIPTEVAQKGEVLISYSDCYTCHKVDKRSVGPAFKDIAKRYPVNKVYIEMLAQKIIIGGSRSWGYPVMDPHPKLSFEDAKMMVNYILSMKK
jgi:cytochrome c